MEIEKIFGKRLKNARIMKGLSMDKLCSAMDNVISKMAISKYENGKIKPNSSIIIAFSNALDLPVDYFVRPFSVNIDSLKIISKKALGSKKEESLKEKIRHSVENYLEIEEITNSSSHFVPPLIESKIKTKEDVKNSVKSLKKLWNIGNGGIVSVISLLEDKGIKILELNDLYSLNSLICMVNEDIPVIVIKNNLSSENKRMMILQELAHIILTFHDSLKEKEKEELIAYFASEVLLPDEVLTKILGKGRNFISFEEIKAINALYGVSSNTIMKKAADSKVISRNHYNNYLKRMKNDSSFKAMVEKSLYRSEESTRYKRLIYKALAEEAITLSKASNLLNEDIKNVNLFF